MGRFVASRYTKTPAGAKTPTGIDNGATFARAYVTDLSYTIAATIFGFGASAWPTAKTKATAAEIPEVLARLAIRHPPSEAGRLAQAAR